MTQWIEWQLKAAGLMALMVIVYALFFRKDRLFNRNRFWLISALVLPWFVPLMAMPAFVKSMLFKPLEGMPVPMLPLPGGVESEMPVQSSFSPDWIFVLSGIYVLVSALLSFRLIKGFLSLNQLRRKALKTSFKGLRVYVLNDMDINPFSFFRSVFIPDSVLKQAERDHILNHERTHCLQWHSVDILLAECLLLLQWWNPFAWWLRKLIAQNHEFCVDQTIMQTVDEPRQYQYALISYLPGSMSLKLVNNFSQSLIKKRIVMMNNTIQNRFLIHIKSLVITGLTVVALLACTDAEKTTFEEATETLAGSRATIEYDDGTRYAVVLTDKGLVEESANLKGARFILNDDLVDWKMIKGLKPGQIKVLGSVPAGKNRKGLLPADNHGAISVYTTDYEFPEMKSQNARPAIYVNNELFQGDMNEIDPKTIAAIKVLKGDGAIEKYGEDYKDGVIEISTKNAEDQTGEADIDVDGGLRIRKVN